MYNFNLGNFASVKKNSKADRDPTLAAEQHHYRDLFLEVRLNFWKKIPS